MIEPAAESGSVFKPLPRRMLLADDVYTYVRDALLTNQIPPGSRLIIEQLSKDLAVSITPIRHALVRLESEGLVMREPFKGYIASPLLDPDTISEIYHARLVIEPQLASSAATSVDADEMNELDRLARTDPMEPRAAEEGSDETTNSDELLHRRIATIGGSKTLAQIITGLNQRLTAYRAFHLQRRAATAWNPAEKSATTVAEHLEIIEAIRDGNAEAAADAMRRHLTNASRRDIDSPPAAS